MPRGPSAMTAPSGLVPPEWQDQGEELLAAWQAFGPPEVVERARRVGELAEVAQRALLHKASMTYVRTGIPQTMEEAREKREYRAEKEVAEKDVDARLAAGTLLAFGSLGRRDADPQWIPSAAWTGLRRDRDQRPDVVRGAGLVFFNVRIIDAKEWSPAAAAEKAPPHISNAPATKALIGGEPLQRAWNAMLKERAEAGLPEPTKNEAETWAATKYSISEVRKLFKALNHKRGRRPAPKKGPP